MNEIIKFYKGHLSKKQSPNILLVGHRIGRQLFGAERSFIDLAKILSDIGFNVFITLPGDNNIKYIKILKNYSIEIYTFFYEWWYNREIDKSILSKFTFLIQKNDIDIIYANTIMLIEPLMVGKALKKKTIVHAREIISEDDELKKFIGLPLEKILNNFFYYSDYIITNSKATYKNYKQKGKDKVFIVPNVVEVNRFAKLDNIIEKKIRFGIISNNLPKKGINDIIEIVKLLDLGYLKKSVFIIIGPYNEYIKNIQKIINNKNLEKYIIIKEYSDSSLNAIKNINVLLSLSHFAESFGRTVSEALAAKRPVIAYNYGAIPELVQHEINGYLASYKNIHEVAKYCVKFIENPQSIIKMGEKGLEKIKEFSYQNVKNKMKDVMNIILNDFYNI